jgi:AraC-like DNA-binding protein
MDFVFNFGDDWERWDQNSKARNDNPGYVVGTMTRPIVVVSEGRIEFLGVRFHPGMAAAFLRCHAADLTDSSVPIDLLLSKRSPIIQERLLQAQDPVERLRMIDQELTMMLFSADEPDRCVETAVQSITNCMGVIGIEKICSRIGITRQHLARRFQQFVGISPKLFSRITRFQALLKSIESDPAPRWASEAYTQGYYDQSHLIGDFLEFTGMTPSEFTAAR